MCERKRSKCGDVGNFCKRLTASTLARACESTPPSVHGVGSGVDTPSHLGSGKATAPPSMPASPHRLTQLFRPALTLCYIRLMRVGQTPVYSTPSVPPLSPLPAPRQGLGREQLRAGQRLQAPRSDAGCSHGGAAVHPAALHLGQEAPRRHRQAQRQAGLSG